MLKSLNFLTVFMLTGSVYAASLEVKEIRCLGGQKNEALIQKQLGKVGDFTTTASAKTLVLNSNGTVKFNHGMIENDEKLTLMIPARGTEDSFCIRPKGSTYLVITIKK